MTDERMGGAQPLGYHIETYGCQMNVRDSETMAGLLESLGMRRAASMQEADVIVFNTCCVRDHAERRVFGNVGFTRLIQGGAAGCGDRRLRLHDAAARGRGAAVRPVSVRQPRVRHACAAPPAGDDPPRACRRAAVRHGRGRPLDRGGASRAPRAGAVGLCEHHVRLQQLLHVLHRALCARGGSARARRRRSSRRCARLRRRDIRRSPCSGRT